MWRLVDLRNTWNYFLWKIGKRSRFSPEYRARTISEIYSGLDLYELYAEFNGWCIHIQKIESNFYAAWIHGPTLPKHTGKYGKFLSEKDAKRWAESVINGSK